jgi:Heterokaryon incompatibility protein (HET)
MSSMSLEQESESIQVSLRLGSDQSQACRTIYEQLPIGEGQTRVLLLHSAMSNEAPVVCSLEIMELEPILTHTYVALSYVWGDPCVAENIMVNGLSFAVTKNLASALRQLRKSCGKVFVWADALCMY